jgi:hypothetical protein
VSWEIYGDPGADPSVFEVQVFYLLASARQHALDDAALEAGGP